MRRISWQVDVGRGGSYFAKVVRDGGTARLDYRMKLAVLEIGGDFAGLVENDAGVDVLNVGSPPLFTREGAVLMTDRHAVVEGALPEGYQGFRCEAANEESLLTVIFSTPTPTTPIGDLRTIRTIEVLCRLDALPGVGDMPALALLHNSGEPTKSFGLRVTDAGLLEGVYGSAPVVSATIPTGQPLHIVLTRSGTSPTDTIQLFVNGVQVDSSVELTVTLSTDYNIFVGSNTSTPPTEWLDVTYFHLGVQAAGLSQVQAADHYASLAWTDVSSDVLDDVNLATERGIRDDSPDARASATSTASLGLNNSAQNTQKTLGYWSTGHPNAAVGWEEGVPIRIAGRVNNGPPIVQFRGWVTNIEPDAGVWDSRVVNVFASDIVETMASTKLSGIPALLDVRGDQVAQVLISRLPQQPSNTNMALGSDVFPIALDNSRDEAITTLAESVRVLDSELGQQFTSRDGTYVWEARDTRILRNGSPVVTINGAFREIDVARDTRDVINRVQATANPRTRDTSNTVVLWALEEIVRVNRGETKTIRGPYRNPLVPQKDARVGGIDMIDPPAPTTDYQLNTANNGTGLNLTASLFVQAEFGANAVTYTVRNDHPLYDGYLVATDGAPRLQARGRGVYAFRTAVMLAENKEAIDKYGVNPVEIDMVYQPSPERAQGACDLILNLWGRRAPRVRSVLLSLNDPTLPADLLERDISDRVRIISALQAVDGEYYINGVALEGLQGGEAHVRWFLVPADPQDYWVLGQVGASELGVTTRLYYV